MNPVDVPTAMNTQTSPQVNLQRFPPLRFIHLAPPQRLAAHSQNVLPSSPNQSRRKSLHRGHCPVLTRFAEGEGKHGQAGI
jgi:hypothetical protein